MTPTLPLAFVAGVLSFLSPCVLPLVPSYLAYVGGSHARSGARWAILSRSLLFVLGFSLIFVALGASASALGSLLSAYRYELSRLGGLLILGFGLFMLGLRLPWLQRDVRLRFQGETRTPVGAVLLGMAFAAGWTPCIGPVLGAALTVAGASGTLGLGVTLLAFYALGLAVPFVLAALMLESFSRFSLRFRRYLPWVERTSGAILVAAGVLMLTGSYTVLNSYLVQFTPDWLWSRL
ncbi:cytochrome c biogenesis CcdA family protein [Truepera radiovictrix]|uniref:Cytochrome c biogenesis protein transmembrane region n=1 Tax=Truepera radiovictrix (strain DSM 17093 / CIP 108686 / LMG 22925 / RQ-24) TaxID=649638 RepID=D7CRR8_TRURR|nr:cytochrome c biogenesis CcdA family protein [Truepera radiovictrix]ADI13558.1 cytochrome c biogenesis protein transmembrane region [Truepera radiovictrix DSM 17093]WMT57880.1 cytochrome c biogenesis CcdA family protein [Truepera radiovictrix]